MRRSVSALAIGVAIGTITACGVPTGPDSFEPIADEEIGRLAEATTTTAPTTTIPPTTTVVPPVTEPTTQPTTTVATVDEEPVNIYFLLRGRLTPFPQNVTAPLTESKLRTVLEDGPPIDTTPRLTSEIERNLIVGATVAGGVITIDLDGSIFGRIPTFREDEAIAQIVLTYLDNLRGVGQVLFTEDGEPLPVRRADSGALTSDPVSFDDYVSLLADQPPVVVDSTTTTTTTTTTTSTTVASTTTSTQPPTDEAELVGTTPVAPSASTAPSTSTAPTTTTG